uniref:Uncharacterized protein n=1 Tax=Pinguiococcus pyrenoidosus TaxID=172671 RepID=A0A7R9U414_9STRA
MPKETYTVRAWLLFRSAPEGASASVRQSKAGEGTGAGLKRVRLHLRKPLERRFNSAEKAPLLPRSGRIVSRWDFEPIASCRRMWRAVEVGRGATVAVGRWVS